MAVNIYSDARLLESTLRDEGLSVWAERLADCISAGATGTEILMGMRWALNELKKNEAELPGHVRDQADQLLADIEVALA